MKRIDAIAKGKSTQMSSSIERKSARIMRNVEQAISYAEDRVEYLEDKAEGLIDSLGNCADAEQTASCQSTINRYVDITKELLDWRETLGALNNLKNKLGEEVQIVEEDK